VFIGQYPCKLKADGTSTNMIVCVTSPANSQTYSLATKVIISNRTPKICYSNNCLFSYTRYYTPIIQEIIPRSAVGDQ
jgi:hypothetical protein